MHHDCTEARKVIRSALSTCATDLGLTEDHDCIGYLVAAEFMSDGTRSRSIIVVSGESDDTVAACWLTEGYMAALDTVVGSMRDDTE